MIKKKLLDYEKKELSFGAIIFKDTNFTAKQKKRFILLTVILILIHFIFEIFLKTNVQNLINIIFFLVLVIWCINLYTITVNIFFRVYNYQSINPFKLKEKYISLKKNKFKSVFLKTQGLYNQKSLDQLIQLTNRHYQDQKTKKYYPTFLIAFILSFLLSIINIDINNSINFLFSAEYISLSIFIIKSEIFLFLIIFSAIIGIYGKFPFKKARRLKNILELLETISVEYRKHK